MAWFILMSFNRLWYILMVEQHSLMFNLTTIHGIIMNLWWFEFIWVLIIALAHCAILGAKIETLRMQLKIHNFSSYYSYFFLSTPIISYDKDWFVHLVKCTVHSDIMTPLSTVVKWVSSIWQFLKSNLERWYVANGIYQLI